MAGKFPPFHATVQAIRSLSLRHTLSFSLSSRVSSNSNPDSGNRNGKPCDDTSSVQLHIASANPPDTIQQMCPEGDEDQTAAAATAQQETAANAAAGILPAEHWVQAARVSSTPFPPGGA